MVRLTKKASETMKRGPGVFKRPGSSAWHWGIKVPADLRNQYASQWAHRCSLETADLREANERASAKHALWLQQFADKRRELNPQRLDKVTPELAQSLAQRVAVELLATDDTLRSDPSAARLLLGTLRTAVPSGLTIGAAPPPAWATEPDDPLQGLGEQLAVELADLNGAMDGLAAREFAMQRVAAILPLAQAEGRKLGVEFDASTPGALPALRECLRAYRKARRDIRLRDLGEVIETPSLPHKPQARPAMPRKLRDVFGLWKGVKRRSDDAVRACERALILFEQRTGNPAVQSITRAQGDDFRAWLQTLGTSSKTAHDRITWVKSLLVYAYRDLELIPRQPWEGLDIEYRTTNKRGPWTAGELKAFFGLPLFTRHELPSESKAGGAAAYWVPLLGLYTGARVGELCQLRVVDVEAGQHGAFIRITEEAEGATVKSAAGHRRVPVHSELVRLGFLDYVQAMRGAGAAQLWPDMKFRKGKPGGYFSDWVNSFHKAATNNPSAPVFHELRHTVRTALHSARVDRETIGRLIGHETGLSEAEKAYTHVSDADLHRALETLAFPAVQLQAVHANRGRGLPPLAPMGAQL
jgi:integrase